MSAGWKEKLCWDPCHLQDNGQADWGKELLYLQKEILLGHYFKLHSSQHEDTPHLYQAYSTQSSASRQLCC
jgi:hypothetical protein